MPDPRVVTPQEAQARLDRMAQQLAAGNRCGTPSDVHRYACTVATEPKRTRAAVVKALRSAGVRAASDDTAIWLADWADAIENGADYA